MKKTKEQKRRWNKTYYDKHQERNVNYVRKARGGDPTTTSRPMPERCECCGGLPSKVRGGVFKLKWDHDHATGKFRGWLCQRCNVFAGFLERNPQLYEQMMKYLGIIKT